MTCFGALTRFALLLVLQHPTTPPERKQIMTIIRSQDQIAAASTKDLVETYNALTGKSIKKFESRGVAESKVANAILGAEFDSGKAGVSKGEKPAAKTKSELKFKANSLGAQLQAASKATSEKSAAAKAAPKAPSARRPKNQPEAVTITLLPEPANRKLQAESNRAKIVALLKKRSGTLRLDKLHAAMAEEMDVATVDGSLSKLVALGWTKMDVAAA
jgi:hypothetical protein